MSSEVAEKRQILNLVFQNLQLDHQKKLILEVKEPFMTLMGIKNGSIRPIDCRRPDPLSASLRRALPPPLRGAPWAAISVGFFETKKHRPQFSSRTRAKQLARFAGKKKLPFRELYFVFFLQTA